MLIKEYRICMPLSVEEYHIGQLYMIAKHSDEQSQKGEGVEVIQNVECDDPVHGKGRFTEKRVYLSNRLPVWIQKLVSRLCSYFYITEKAWNHYPHTMTEYTCSFVPKFSIHIDTRYENNSGTTENCLSLSEAELSEREVVPVDIAYNNVPEKYYKENEDPTKFKSKKTGRGHLQKDWRETSNPIMCSYKLVRVKFELWGLQTRVESFVHKAIQDILLLGHRQAFSWIDEWYDMTEEDVRKYEQRLQAETNRKVHQGLERTSSRDSTDAGDDDEFADAVEDQSDLAQGGS
ncbi:cytoplasmic phosphatidylinositol transfer protein 1 [Strongylocentrotus purpuratus]|uniref:Cytoplasmic phosphatidylinositol transfer protein 1 n=1 Tax=Strongylocentrotus purpuratus TaxID=7668 RepID=A0A7M7NRE7_STRPU|nr:cytoplasmic phosphatidylinositol transfer protein 1-like [Strongylocentrotus purpuratus]XP_030842145.1 cytoplasmic phosphatidylinositol transfer protein 1 [Strongylocentrotus purpuratus]